LETGVDKQKLIVSYFFIETVS